MRGSVGDGRGTKAPFERRVRRGVVPSEPTSGGDFGGAALNIGGFAGELGAPVQVQNAFAGAGHALKGDLDELAELLQLSRLANLRG